MQYALFRLSRLWTVARWHDVGEARYELQLDRLLAETSPLAELTVCEDVLWETTKFTRNWCQLGMLVRHCSVASAEEWLIGRQCQAFSKGADRHVECDAALPDTSTGLLINGHSTKVFIGLLHSPVQAITDAQHDADERGKRVVRCTFLERDRALQAQANARCGFVH